MPLGLGSNLNKTGMPVVSHVTSNLKMLHRYNTGSVVPVSDGAAYFNVSNTDYIDIGDASNYNSNVHSISAWIWFNNSADNKFIFDARDGDNDGILLFLDGSERLSNQIMTVDGLYTTALSEKTWHHVASTNDGTTSKLYLNGVEIETADTSGVTVSTTGSNKAYLGSRSHSGRLYYWDGYMANAGFWSGALTQAQIKSIMWKNYAGLLDSEKTNLVSWWNLDDTIDSTATLGNTVIYDNHNATLGSNLVVNGTFDSETGWTDANIGGSDDVDLSQDYVKVGTNSLKIVGTADHDGTQGTLTINTTIGKLYKISCWVYVISGVAELNPGDTPFGSYSPATDEEAFSSTTNQWEQLITYAWCDVAGGSGGGSFYISCRGGAATFYVDDVKLQEVQGNPGELK